MKKRIIMILLIILVLLFSFIIYQLIKFKNYAHEDARWLQGTQLKDSQELIDRYSATL